MVYSRILALKTPPKLAKIGMIIAQIGQKEEIFTGGAARFWAFEAWGNKRQQMNTKHYTLLRYVAWREHISLQIITHEHTGTPNNTYEHKSLQFV